MDRRSMLACLPYLSPALVQLAGCLDVARRPSSVIRRVAVICYSEPDAHTHAEKLGAACLALGIDGVEFVTVRAGARETVTDDSTINFVQWRELVAAVATSGLLAKVLRHNAPELPLIFATAGDPRLDGLVDELVRPGRKATGFTYEASIDGKRLDLLVEAFPDVRAVALVVDHAVLKVAGHTSTFLTALRSAGLVGKIIAADSCAELVDYVEQGKATDMDAFIVPVSAAVDGAESKVVELFERIRKPAIFGYDLFVKEGGLMSFDALIPAPYSVLAKQLALVLYGLDAGQIPVEFPKDFKLAVNLDAAEKQAWAIPDSIIERSQLVVGRVVGSRTRR